MSWSPLVYPSNTPSSQPLSYTPLVAFSPHPSSYSHSPVSTRGYSEPTVLSSVSDTTFYGTAFLVGFALVYSTYSAIYYFRAYKKEKGRRKKYDEVQRKFNLTSGVRP